MLRIEVNKNAGKVEFTGDMKQLMIDFTIGTKTIIAQLPEDQRKTFLTFVTTPLLGEALKK